MLLACCHNSEDCSGSLQSFRSQLKVTAQNTTQKVSCAKTNPYALYVCLVAAFQLKCFKLLCFTLLNIEPIALVDNRDF